jgi:hypothetical protein
VRFVENEKIFVNRQTRWATNPNIYVYYEELRRYSTFEPVELFWWNFGSLPNSSQVIFWQYFGGPRTLGLGPRALGGQMSYFSTFAILACAKIWAPSLRISLEYLSSWGQCHLFAPPFLSTESNKCVYLGIG